MPSIGTQICELYTIPVAPPVGADFDQLSWKFLTDATDHLVQAPTFQVFVVSLRPVFKIAFPSIGAGIFKFYFKIYI